MTIRRDLQHLEEGGLRSVEKTSMTSTLSLSMAS
ncbi:hypothetical protein [Megasphaera massiliensis]|nr:hypothetical protein [Megasphaera massiliensis]MCQ5211633.1 hypothetical protein [Megasphaera massiliensis]